MNTQSNFERFSEYANQGDVFAQEVLENHNDEIKLGMTQQEEMESNPYFSLLLALRDDAEQGNADAQYSLGLFFLTRHGREELNPNEGVKWLRLAATQGHVKAQLALGGLYVSILVEDGHIDEKECLSWLERAVEQGNIQAIGIAGALTNNMEALTKAAETGDVSASFNLSNIYAKGRSGTELNPQKAFYWMLKAAEGGYAMAQRYVAYMYCTGNGTHKSLTQARYWLMKAMEQEYEMSKWRNKDCTAILTVY